MPSRRSFSTTALLCSSSLAENSRVSRLLLIGQNGEVGRARHSLRELPVLSDSVCGKSAKAQDAHETIGASSVEGARSRIQASSKARSLLIPRGHRRSTSTRLPSARAGLSYTPFDRDGHGFALLLYVYCRRASSVIRVECMKISRMANPLG